MDAFEKFIVSDAFFPVLIFLSLLLIGVFVWIIISNRRDERSRRTTSSQSNNFEGKQEIKIIQDTNYVKQEKKEVVEQPRSTTNEIKIVENVETPKITSSLTITDITSEVMEKKNKEVSIQEPVTTSVEEVKTPEIVEEGKTPEVTENKELPKVDIPIKEMTDDSVSVPELKRLTSDEGETVEIELTSPLNETNVETSEIVNVEETKQIPVSEDKGEEISVPEISEQVTETPEENAYDIVIEETKQEEEPKEEIVEIPSAFETTTDGNSEINEDIVVEPPKEYTVEKTEIFDFPDFSKLDDESKDDELTESMIEAANKYIESIMTK